MRKVLVVIFTLAFVPAGLAQQSDPDAPATKGDVQRYFDVLHYHDMMNNMMKVMSKSLKDMAHERCAKQTGQSAEECEAAVDKSMDQALNNLPIDEMVQAMVPILQKHMTKGDVDELVTFYSSPTGQKMLREQPQMMAELMQAMKPIMTERIDSIQKDMEQQIAEMTKHSAQKSDGAKAKN